MTTPIPLQYISFSSNINPSFWHKLTQVKLDIDKLDENSRKIWGTFSLFTSSYKKIFLEVDSTSFNNDYEDHYSNIPIQGEILNKNTIEEFKNCNKNDLMQLQGDTYWNKVVKDGINDPSVLLSFFILSFADLKKYEYYYWFAFPVIFEFKLQIIEKDYLKNIATKEEMSEIYEDFFKLETKQKCFFILDVETKKIHILSEIIPKNLDDTKHAFAFIDPSNNENPIWYLKNYANFISHNCPDLKDKPLKFLSFRLTKVDKSLLIENSLLLTMKLEVNETKNQWVGWERNERDHMGPRKVNMRESMDPKVLAETSVDLNLKLMKWRVMPDIDLEKIKRTKCLILGSGTLGCSVARVLLGWGVRYIDFVDNGLVNYSNPVRQSLFTFEDSVEKREKAKAASDNLKKIFPGVDSNGYTFSIPMPGHPVSESLKQENQEIVEKLSELISKSDIVFLLMDSRESRWLPTLLCQHFSKLAINAALGFDTYLVMRHGLRTESNFVYKNTDGFRLIKGNELGCYFCNDVTAPGDSMKDKTLDQQCTVTRPGVSQIAGALAVELAISVTQHEFGPLAPSFCKLYKTPNDVTLDNDCILGLLPHSIRGFLYNFEQIQPATERYKQCIACSEPVLDRFKKDGYEFLFEVFQSSKCLEEITGIDKMHQIDEEKVWNLSDLDDEDDF